MHIILYNIVWSIIASVYSIHHVLFSMIHSALFILFLIRILQAVGDDVRTTPFTRHYPCCGGAICRFSPEMRQAKHQVASEVPTKPPSVIYPSLVAPPLRGWANHLTGQTTQYFTGPTANHTVVSCAPPSQTTASNYRWRQQSVSPFRPSDQST